MMSLKKFTEDECKCQTCSSMCRRPCWGTPKEMQAIIDAGYGDRLMLDYWVGSEEGESSDTYLLCPALKGYESKETPWSPRSEKGCTFWKRGLCELHDKGLKPLEARAVSCKIEENEDVHSYCASSWKNKKAQTLVNKWKKDNEVD